MNVCALCEARIEPGDGAAAFRGRVAHIACWLEWRDGRRASPRPSVLVVDDDDATRYTTRRVLEAAGFTVTELERFNIPENARGPSSAAVLGSAVPA